MRTQDILKITGVLATLLNAGSAAAQDGAWILERVDSTLNAPLDVVAVEQMTLVDAGGREKVRTLQMYQKGPEQRMVKFVAPADVRDVGFLRLAEDRMYLYLPAFRRDTGALSRTATPVPESRSTSWHVTS